jgi:hypothetical protein
MSLLLTLYLRPHARREELHLYILALFIESITLLLGIFTQTQQFAEIMGVGNDYETKILDVMLIILSASVLSPILVKFLLVVARYVLQCCYKHQAAAAEEGGDKIEETIKSQYACKQQEKDIVNSFHPDDDVQDAVEICSVGESEEVKVVQTSASSAASQSKRAWQ